MVVKLHESLFQNIREVYGMSIRELTIKQMLEFQELKELGWSNKKILEEMFKSRDRRGL